jgi:hypothetical protein
MGKRLGYVAANLLSVVLRPLGYVIFGILMMVYRRDPRAIGYFVAAGLVIAGLVWSQVGQRASEPNADGQSLQPLPEKKQNPEDGFKR